MEENLQLKRILEARERLRKHFKHWGYIASVLNVCEATWLPTGATDGASFFYNPKFVETLTDAQLVFLWAHEVFHVVGDHKGRTPNYVWNLKEPNKSYTFHKWNVARDYAINSILKPVCDSYPSEIEWIPESLYDVQYEGMASERIYKLLKDPPSLKVSVHIVTDPTGNPFMIDGEGNQTPLAIDFDDSVKQKIKEAKDKIKSEKESPEGSKDSEEEKTQKDKSRSGDELGGGAGFGDPQALRSVKIESSKELWDWKHELIDFAIIQARSNYSYSRIHRSWFHQTGCIVPTLRSEFLQGVIAIDVSGSISDVQYNKFAAEIDGIRGQIPDHELHLIFCADHITHVLEVKSGEPIDWTLRGTGGTRFNPVFEHIKENLPDTNFLLYFTDGENSNEPELNKQNPDYEVRWILWNNSRYSHIPENLGRKVYMHRE